MKDRRIPLRRNIDADYRPKWWYAIEWRAAPDQETPYISLRGPGKELKEGISVIMNAGHNPIPSDQWRILKRYGRVRSWDDDEAIHWNFKLDFPPLPTTPRRADAWIDRKGNFYRVPFQGHWSLAKELGIAYCGASENEIDPTEVLTKRGWLQVYFTGQFHTDKLVTKAQERTLRKMAGLGDDDYREMIEAKLAFNSRMFGDEK